MINNIKKNNKKNHNSTPVLISSWASECIYSNPPAVDSNTDCLLLLHLTVSGPPVQPSLRSIQMPEPLCRFGPTSETKEEKKTKNLKPGELGKWLTSDLCTTETEAGGLIQAGVWHTVRSVSHWPSLRPPLSVNLHLCVTGWGGGGGLN